MGKLLQTRLPTSIGEISSETFNRLVRVLELSLNTVDVDATLSVNETQRNENKFNKGDAEEHINPKFNCYSTEFYLNLINFQRFFISSITSNSYSFS